MKKLSHFTRRIFIALESTPLSLSLWMVTFLSLIVIRLCIDLLIEKAPALTFFQLFFQFTHLFLFFFFSYILLLPIVKAVGETTFPKAARVLLFGFLVILFPPLIDKLIFGESLYWSFYIFDSLANMPERFFTFFGDKPHLGITYGVRTEVALVLGGIFLYGLSKTKHIGRTLFYTLLAYTLLFFLGTLPSWISYVILFPHIPLLAITDTHIAELFLSPEVVLGRSLPDLRSALAYKMSLLLCIFSVFSILLLWYRVRTEEWKSCMRNVRWPQVIYHNGLLILGMLLALLYTDTSLPHGIFSFFALGVLCLAVTAAWLASVVWNDLSDERIDIHTNTSRPLITQILHREQYTLYAIILFGFSLLSAALVHFQAALFLLAYQAIATIYSVPPFRLKRFLGIATLLASCAVLLILFIGYSALHPTHTLQGLPTSMIWYLLGIYTLLLPLKDFKDVAGDSKDHVYTLPVLLGIERAKIVMSSISFLIFMSSIFVLHIPHLLLWAFLFATLSFWIIQRAGTPTSMISYKMLSAIFIALAIGYGVGLTFFLL